MPSGSGGVGSCDAAPLGAIPCLDAFTGRDARARANRTLGIGPAVAPACCYAPFGVVVFTNRPSDSLDRGPRRRAHGTRSVLAQGERRRSGPPRGSRLRRTSSRAAAMRLSATGTSSRSRRPRGKSAAHRNPRRDARPRRRRQARRGSDDCRPRRRRARARRALGPISRHRGVRAPSNFAPRPGRQRSRCLRPYPGGGPPARARSRGSNLRAVLRRDGPRGTRPTTAERGTLRLGARATPVFAPSSAGKRPMLRPAMQSVRAHRWRTLSLAPRTGRTHQNRVHAAHAGAPLVGNRAYGGPARITLPSGRVVEPRRIALHAARVAVPDDSGNPFVVSSPISVDLRDLWVLLGGDPDAWGLVCVIALG